MEAESSAISFTTFAAATAYGRCSDSWIKPWMAGTEPPLDPSLARQILRDCDDAGELAAANAEALFSAWLDGGLAAP